MSQFSPAHLSETAAPGHNLSVDFLANLLLMVHDCLQETVQMVGGAVIMLDERLKALGQVHVQLWGVVPSHGLAAQMELVFIVI